MVDTNLSAYQPINITTFSWQYQEINTITMRTSAKTTRRQNIRFRIRAKISGTATKPRLSVFRSNAEIYCQLIDDINAATIAAASSRDKDIAAQKGTKSEKSKLVGQAIARKAKDLGIETVVFDRGGNLFHGRVKQVAEGAREGGLKF
jgi:large subunit ribosomal protein L18